MDIKTGTLQNHDSLFPFENFPFEVKRIFFVNATDTIRGKHAHKKATQILICTLGTIKVYLSKREFITLNQGDWILIPPLQYAEQHYIGQSQLLVLTNTLYSPDDYIAGYPLR